MSCHEEPCDCGAHACDDGQEYVHIDLVVAVPKKFAADDDTLMLFVDRELPMRGLSCDVAGEPAVQRPKESVDDPESPAD